MRIIFVLFLVGNLFASDFFTNINKDLLYQKNHNISLSFGVANVRSHEYVWSLPFKISELEWKAKNIPVAKLSLNNIIFDLLILDSEFYVKLVNTKGKMIDDDWVDGLQDDGVLLPDSQRDPSKHTHRSIHDDTKVKNFYGYDIALKTLPIGILHTNVSVGFGLRYDYVKFYAKGGRYFYDCSGGYPNGCANIGLFDNVKVIEYEQSFVSPYLGLYLSWYDLNGFDVGVNFKYSNFVYGNDFDKHLLRDTTFETEADDMKFYNIKAYGSYMIDKNFSLILEFDYSKYKHKVSDVYIVDYSAENGSGVSKDGSSFDNTTFKSSVGFIYNF